MIFSNTINIKTFVLPIKYGARWRTPKDPYQRHSNPRFSNPTFFENPDRIENVNTQTETAIAAGELIHEVVSRRRFKNKKAWAGSGMTWVVQYDKKNDSVYMRSSRLNSKAIVTPLRLCLKMGLGMRGLVGKMIMRAINRS